MIFSKAVSHGLTGFVKSLAAIWQGLMTMSVRRAARDY